MDKYTGLATVYHFQPIAVEMLGPINGSASDFLSALAKISQCSGDERETAFLFQRISVLMQRYNSILLHESLIPRVKKHNNNNNNNNMCICIPL